MSSNIKLDNYKGLKIDIDYKDIVDEYAEKTKRILYVYSNKRKSRRKNNYASTWAIKELDKGNYDGRQRKSGTFYGVKVWNEKNYRLTHLLENGHLIVNKKGGVGWARGNHHIERAYKNVKQPFENAMKRAKIDVDFK